MVGFYLLLIMVGQKKRKRVPIGADTHLITLCELSFARVSIVKLNFQ